METKPTGLTRNDQSAIVLNTPDLERNRPIWSPRPDGTDLGPDGHLGTRNQTKTDLSGPLNERAQCPPEPERISVLSRPVRVRALAAIAALIISPVLVGCGDDQTAEASIEEGDVCPNIPQFQAYPPPDSDGRSYVIDANGDCVPPSDASSADVANDSGDSEGVGSEGTISAVLESPSGTRIRVDMRVGEPVPARDALNSSAGQTLREGCSHPNMDFWFDNISTQVVPITWTAVDESPGGFSWDPASNAMQRIVFPQLTPTVGSSLWGGVTDCSPNLNGVFGAGDGVSFPYQRDVYTPNQPEGSFSVDHLVAGALGNVVECEISVDPALFDDQLEPVDDGKGCGVTATGSFP